MSASTLSSASGIVSTLSCSVAGVGAISGSGSGVVSDPNTPVSTFSFASFVCVGCATFSSGSAVTPDKKRKTNSATPKINPIFFLVIFLLITLVKIAGLISPTIKPINEMRNKPKNKFDMAF